MHKRSPQPSGRARFQKPQKSTSWGGVASWYDALLEQQDDTFQQQVIAPQLTRLLQPQPGMRVLDVACGQGFFSRAWYAAGAQVVASDIAPELIARAREHSPAEIAYHVSSADDCSFVADASMDAVTIVLALQNIERVDPVLRECARVLKPSGRLYVVLNHPAFRSPKTSSWGWDEERRAQFRRVDEYMTEKKHVIEMHPGVSDAVTFSFHRPLQLYFKHLFKTGFAVTRFEEWVSHRTSTSGPRAAAENKARNEIPLFLCFEAVKQ